jgi:hypothetical protein
MFFCIKLFTKATKIIRYFNKFVINCKLVSMERTNSGLAKINYPIMISLLFNPEGYYEMNKSDNTKFIICFRL